MPDKLTDFRFAPAQGATIEQLASYGEQFARWQRSLNWWIGDLAIYVEARWPDTHTQVWPEWISPGLVARCKAVAAAYPPDARNIHATWSIHMKYAGQPDRFARVQASVDAGRTTDEERKAAALESAGKRWLLAIDAHYYLHRYWFSGAGIAAALGVSKWIARTVDRMRDMGLTDVVCAFDSGISNRKELTKDWEDKYKDRPPKDPELVQQLRLVRQLLEGDGFCCVHVDGWEADDVLASYAAQFPGTVTILSMDKDCRQLLDKGKVNILLDIVWHEDPESENHTIEYKWMTYDDLFEDTGLTPEQWVDFQCLMGDAVDGVTGCAGVGVKGAANLVKTYGSALNAVQAAQSGDVALKPRIRQSLVDFADKLDITTQLVTLNRSLTVPVTTRI